MEAHIAKEMEAKAEEMEAHIAKETEANKKDKDEEPKTNEASKKTDEGDDNAKTADITEDKKDTTEETTVAKPEKLDTKVKDGIDTAIKVETPTKTETAKSDSEADKADVDDDDDFMFEMDEDTFHHFQQAEVEAENKATEAQSRAIASFCNIIFQTIIAAVFVAKLNQVYEERDEVPPIDGTTSFSTFWILFPFLLISGCIICCFACAIFGASNIDTALSSDDDDNEDGDNTGGEEEAADTNGNEASPVILTPPPPSSQGADDPPTQKSDAESNAKPESPNKAEEGSAPTEAEDMDDLD